MKSILSLLLCCLLVVTLCALTSLTLHYKMI